jgi:hypothetical protein
MSIASAMLVRRASGDPSVVDKTRAAGRRVIRRGAQVVAATWIPTLVLDAVGPVQSELLVLLTMAAGVVSGIGLGMVVIGIRRLLVAKAAARRIEAGRIPVAQLLR